MASRRWFSQWQDAVLLAWQLVFAATLIPTAVDGVSIPYWTSVPAVAVMVAFALTFASLRLRGAALSSLLNAAMWLTVLVRS